MSISNMNDTADAIREFAAWKREQRVMAEGKHQMIEIDADEMFQKIMQFTQQNLRAMQQNKWEDFAKNREELDTWFISHGVKLVSKEPS